MALREEAVVWYGLRYTINSCLWFVPPALSVMALESEFSQFVSHNDFLVKICATFSSVW